MQVQTLTNCIEDNPIEKFQLLNLSIHNMSMEEVLASLNAGVVFTPNVDHFVKLQYDQEFFDAYQKADYKLCDSKIVYYAAKFLGYPIKEKVSGSDLFPHFYRY
ncbi:MAG: glycosyltransferase, partial [Bacteroidota bacterium]